MALSGCPPAKTLLKFLYTFETGMSMSQQISSGEIRDLDPEEICPSVDVNAVAEILRRAHPDVESDDLMARILEVLEDGGP